MENNSKTFWEHKFIELFSKNNNDNCTPHFEYKNDSEKMLAMGETYLTIITFNPSKGASFLLLDIIAKSEEEAIQKAFEELVSMYKQENYSSYTLEWGKKGESSTHHSYFYAKNEFEVLRRFYSEMEPDSVTFYSLKVNPLS